MRNIRQLLVALMMSAVVACGGGGTLGESGGGTPTPSYSISLRLISTVTNTESNDLKKANPLKVIAKVTATNGSASGKIVTFSLSDAALATFSNQAGTAVTNSSGEAEIGLTTGTKSGAGEVLASVEGGPSFRIAFQSAGDIGSSSDFVITLSLTGGNEVRRNNDLTVRAELKSAAGVAQPGKLIQFSLNDTALASFSNQTGTAITDASGIAEILLKVGTKSGSGTISARYVESSQTIANINFTSAGDGGVVDTTPVNSVLLSADKLQLGSGDTDRVELFAIVKDKNNVLMENVQVQFSADNNAELEVASNVTGANGIAKAYLYSKTDYSLRPIKVTATAGAAQVKSEVTINVVGTEIDVLAPTAVVTGGSAQLTIGLLDATGKGIRDTQLSIRSSLNNTFNDPNPRTDANTGRVVVQYTAANEGNDLITISALGVSKTFAIFVDPDTFNFQPTAQEVPEIHLNVTGPLAVRWTRSNSPLVGSPVLFATTRGEIAATPAELSGQVTTTVNTNTSGVSEVVVRSAFAGLTNISASSTGTDRKITANKLVEFVAVTPTKMEVQVFPAQVGPGEKATVRAIVRDALNNPVKNQTIAFSLSNSAGGQLSPATSITNSQGVATTEFTADTSSPGTGTPLDPSGLRINATVTTATAVTGNTGISIGRRTLFFRFGSGGPIFTPETNLLSVPYAIIVTDASGNPVPNQELNVAVTPNVYLKGAPIRFPEFGAFIRWVPTSTVICASEDVNRNGILDAGEDINRDQQITPGNIATVSRTVVADSNGIAQVNMIYPREYGAYVGVDMQVSAFAAGTENVTTRPFVLPYLSNDYSTESNVPPQSPFGTGKVVISGNIGFIENGMEGYRAPLCTDLN